MKAPPAGDPIPSTLVNMTLARYHGTGLAARPGIRGRPRWSAAAVRVPLLPPVPGRQRRPVDARLAHPAGLRLQLRLPGAARRRLPGLRPSGTAAPAPRRPRGLQPLRPQPSLPLLGLAPASWHTLRQRPPPPHAAVALPAGGHVLTAQQHVDALISALLSAQGLRPAEAAALRQYLDDACAVARAAISAAGRAASFPAAVTAVLDELGARTGPMSAFASPPRAPPRNLAPVTGSASPSPTSCCTRPSPATDPVSPAGSPPMPSSHPAR